MPESDEEADSRAYASSIQYPSMNPVYEDRSCFAASTTAKNQLHTALQVRILRCKLLYTLGTVYKAPHVV